MCSSDLVGGVLGGFALAVLVALGVGWLVGEVSLRIRSHVTDPTVDTVLSFTVPFLAAIPAEHIHGSDPVRRSHAQRARAFGPR